LFQERAAAASRSHAGVGHFGRQGKVRRAYALTHTCLCEAPALVSYPEIAVPSVSATLSRVILPRVRFDFPEGLVRVSVMIE